jgi:putative chitinase
MIDRQIFFDIVRNNPFGGKLSQQQVDGMSFKLEVFERDFNWNDLRWLANCFAQGAHETGMKMWPVEEGGKGQGAEYGKPDPVTGQTYYGRGDIQITWSDNYKRADSELGLTGDRSCYWHAENALDPEISAAIMYQGMSKGWFRKNSAGAAQTLALYFNDTRDDPFGAREIVNGDKNKIPSWSNGVSIGNLIVSYHKGFLAALQAAYIEVPYPEPPIEEKVVQVVISAPAGVRVDVVINPDASV